MRWIGSSSTMSLIQSFKAATAAPHNRASPMADDSGQPNKLYFPASVFFGKVRALPSPEEVEYPERDLADKLVSSSASVFACRQFTLDLGHCIFLEISFLVTGHRQTYIYETIYLSNGPQRRSALSPHADRIHRHGVCFIRMCIPARRRSPVERRQGRRWGDGHGLLRTVGYI